MQMRVEPTFVAAKDLHHFAQSYRLQTRVLLVSVCVPQSVHQTQMRAVLMGVVEAVGRVQAGQHVLPAHAPLFRALIQAMFYTTGSAAHQLAQSTRVEIMGVVEAVGRVQTAHHVLTALAPPPLVPAQMQLMFYTTESAAHQLAQMQLVT